MASAVAVRKSLKHTSYGGVRRLTVFVSIWRYTLPTAGERWRVTQYISRATTAAPRADIYAQRN